MLGPVYSHVTHFVPPLIIAPAIALDLLRPKIQTWSGWRRSLACRAVFLAVLLAVQWPFADFSAVAGFAQLGLRNAVLSLLRSAHG